MVLVDVNQMHALEGWWTFATGLEVNNLSQLAAPEG